MAECTHEFRPIDSNGQIACIHCNARYRQELVPLKDVMGAYYRWWNSITREGDPSRRPNLSIDSFKAGWEARGSVDVSGDT